MKKNIYKIIFLLAILPTFLAILPPKEVRAYHVCDQITGAGCSADTVQKTPGISQGKDYTSVKNAELNTEGGWLWKAFKRGIATAILSVSAAFLFLAGVALNYTISFTILGMSAYIDQLVAINAGWAVFRDLANIFFIFVLIWIAVSTILSLDSRATRKTLINIIFIALIINFSLFFTKVIIDASNIVTVQFYNATMNTAGIGTANPITQGLSLAFVRPLFLGSFFDTTSGNIDTANLLNDDQRFFTVALMGSLFMLVATFVFLGAAILLVIRFVVLVFLMITSPIAYIASIVPHASGISSKWWKALIDQCVFAPVLMMFLWFVASLLNSPQFRNLIVGRFSGQSLAAASQGSVGGVEVVMNFLIVIGFMVASLLVAKQAGAMGSGFAAGVAGKFSFGAAGLLGRSTAGLAGSRLASRMQGAREDSKSRIDRALYKFKSTRTGDVALRVANKAADSSFDIRSSSLGSLAKGTGVDLGKAGGKGGYQKEYEAKVKERVKFAERNYKTEEDQVAYAERLAKGNPAINLASSIIGIRQAQREAAESIGSLKIRQANQKVNGQIAEIQKNSEALKQEAEKQEKIIERMSQQQSGRYPNSEEIAKLDAEEEDLKNKKNKLDSYKKQTDALKEQLKPTKKKDKTVKDQISEALEGVKVKEEGSEKDSDEKH